MRTTQNLLFLTAVLFTSGVGAADAMGYGIASGPGIALNYDG